MSDYALAQRAAGGDLSAFEVLYERHNRRVYSLCLRMTQNVAEAEDLAQEATPTPSCRNIFYRDSPHRIHAASATT